MSDSTALAVDLRANVKQFERSMKLAANQTESQLRKIEKRFDAANKKLDKDALRTRAAFTSAAGGVDVMTGSVQRWAAVLAGAFSVREVTRMADTFTALQNRLKVAGLAGQELAQVQDHLFKSASQNGVEISALGDLYGRLALSTGELGVSQGELLQFVDGVTASLRVQGTSSQAASGALMQLSQALGAGTVRAEEMNSIMEATPIIAQAAARGMKKLDLREVSIVSFPANDKATVTSVKTERAADFVRRLREGEPPSTKEFEDILGDLGVPKALRAGIASHGYAKAIRSESGGIDPAVKSAMTDLRAALDGFLNPRT